MAPAAETYQRVRNVTLPTPDGTTQIHHVIVCPYGVFVIETKFMQRLLCGRAEEQYWTQRIGRRSYRLQNPLRQNVKHVQALKALLDLPDTAIHSVVVFTRTGRFKTERPANVLLRGSYLTYIKSFCTPALTDRQIEATLQKIRSGRLAPTRATHRQHIRHPRSPLDPSAQRDCPLCGAAMVLHTVKHSANKGSRFWGCSNYPRCRVMQPISEKALVATRPAPDSPAAGSIEAGPERRPHSPQAARASTMTKAAQHAHAPHSGRPHSSVRHATCEGGSVCERTLA